MYSQGFGDITSIGLWTYREKESKQNIDMYVIPCYDPG